MAPIPETVGGIRKNDMIQKPKSYPLGIGYPSYPLKAYSLIHKPIPWVFPSVSPLDIPPEFPCHPYPHERFKNLPKAHSPHHPHLPSNPL